jgi:hypothetical protein
MFQTGEMLLEGIEDMPESFEDMDLREEVLAGVRECGLSDVSPLIQVYALCLRLRTQLCVCSIYYLTILSYFYTM